MTVPLTQHQDEIQRNREAWRSKPLLREVYRQIHRQIIDLIDFQMPGRIVEIGAGIGNLKAHLPQTLSTDLFSNPDIDVVCDGYALPFGESTLSHLILFDVFHHLCAPNAFLVEARRALQPSGRVIICDPFISWVGRLAYGAFHHEPIGWNKPVDMADSPPRAQDYYAAQGNATRLFFNREHPGWPPGWSIHYAKAFASFSYLLSGGFSKRALYPAACLPLLQRADRVLSRWPRVFGARCLVVLQPEG